MTDFDYPQLSTDFFLPEVSIETATDAFRTHAQIERDLKSREEALRNADQESVRKAQRDAHLAQYSQIDFTTIEPIDEFIERTCYDPLTVNPVTLNYRNGRLLSLEPFQRRILKHIFNPTADTVSKYVTVIWSQPKKSGKTQISASVVAWFAKYIDPPNNILVVANKRDQAKGRTYRAALPTLKALEADIATARNSAPEARMPNGTTVKAIPNDPTTEAGDFYSLTAWTEIWAFKSETDSRLFAELMPVETVRVSMQWIDTYVGYIDESITLLNLWQNFFTIESGFTELAPGARYVEELADITTTNNRPCCVENPDKEMFLFWDHERRMPWQTEKAKKREWGKLGKVEAVRLLENRWQSSSGELLDEDWILRSIRDEEVAKYASEPFVLAVDGAMRHDSISLVGSIKVDDRYITTFCEIYDPHGQDADLHTLIEERIKQLFDDGRLLTYRDDDDQWKTQVFFDIYQLHQIRLNLIDYGLDVIEFSQGSWRNISDTMLYHAYKDDLVSNPNNPMLLEHLRGGKAKYSENEVIRIIKGTTKDAKRIDGLVAQSMSFYGSFRVEQEMLKQEPSIGLLLQDTTEDGWFSSDAD